MRSFLASSLLAALALLGCRQPSAELQLPPDPGAEPSGRGQQVFVEAPSPITGQTILDWDTVDNSLASLITGERQRVDYGADHPWLGANTALVTFVVFSDYQCPYCGRLDDALMELLGRYGDRVRVVYRQFPLVMHREAELAAAVALAAHDQGRFAEMHAWLFDNSRNLDHPTIAKQAAQIGLDAQRLLDEVTAGIHDDRIDADLAVGKQFGVTGTPAFWVNGRPFSGAMSADDLDAIVNEELDLARRLIAAGSTPEQVWARIMAASRPGSPSLTVTGYERWPTAVAGLPMRGASQAKVELLMCADFDCPFCKKSTTTLDQLQAQYPSELAIYFRHRPLPMHTHARAAHRAAVAAHNQGKFWEMFELLFAEQRQRSDAELEAMAKSIGLDLKRFRRDVAAKATDELIDEQSTYCENNLDASGTPTFFVNGRKVVGARPAEDFELVIEDELASGSPP